MKSKKANEFLERNRICDDVMIGDAVVAISIAERELISKVEKAWDTMSEATRFDIPADVLIKAKNVFIESLMKDEAV